MSEELQIIDIEYALDLSDGDEEILLTILESMAENFPLDLKECREAIKKNDIEFIWRKTHSMKSTTKSLGAVKIVEAAYEIEKAGKNNDMEKAKELFPAFENMILELQDEIKICIERYS